MLVPVVQGSALSCWVCLGDPVFTDEHDLDWCQEHIDIWKKAWDETADDPSF